MYPTDEGKATTTALSASSSRAIDNALQVLAATASNDHLRERYHDDKSSNSNTSSLSHHDGGVMMTKRNVDAAATAAGRGGGDDKSSDANSEDDESGSGCSGSSSSAVISKTTGLRKGKWTVEEEEYATRFIHYFSSGLLCLPEGKTLRASLAEKLQCDPMRITKKYGGASCLGNKISKLCNRPRFLAQDIEMARLEIARLERRFHLRMAQGGDVPLPPDNENDLSVVQMHAVASTSPHLNANAATLAPSGGAMHMNVSFPQLSAPSVPVMRPVTTSMINATTQPTLTIPKATTTPAMSSYLATLAGNAQLAAAAASISPAALMVGVPTPQQQQPQPAPAPLVQQQINPIVQQQINPNMHNNQTISQAMAAVPAVNWPMVIQGISQAGINSTTAGLSASNKQLVQTLLLQITSQLQALAALSPSTMKQIQLQILAATTTTATPTVPQNPPPPQQAHLAWAAPATATPDTVSLFSSFQLAAARQVQSGLAATGGLPSSAGLQNAALSFGQATGPVQQNFIVSTNSSTPVSSVSSIQAPPHSKLIGVHVQQQQQQASQGQLPVKRVSDTASVLQREASTLSSSSSSSNTTGNNMEEFLIKLRQRHAEAVEQARREQASDRASKKQKTSNNEGSSSNSGIVTLLPFEHATTESSGSGCTTNEGSTSSVENVPASDETRNDGSTSSNSSSEEDDAESGGQASSSSSHHKPSIPLRKRFRSENNGGVGGGNGGGITRRNLADHNYRMAEEMKNQDK